MRLTGVMLVTTAAILAFSQWTSALNTDFSPEAVKQLIAEGQAIQSQEEFDEKYEITIMAEGWDDYLTLTSARAHLRFSAWLKVEPFAFDFSVAHPTLTVFVHSFGNSEDFASDAELVMVQGENSVYPDDGAVLDSRKSTRKDYRYERLVAADFRYVNFNPEEPATFIFTRDGEVIAFDVNLAGIE